MTTNELLRISIIRKEVNKYGEFTREEASEYVQEIFSTLINNDGLVDFCREYFEEKGFTKLNNFLWQ